MSASKGMYLPTVIAPIASIGVKLPTAASDPRPT